MRYEDIVGQSEAVSALRAAANQGETAHAYLFAGPAGTGKRTLADVFMRALHCVAKDKPCDQCPACQKHLAGEHPDLHILSAVKASIGVEEIRGLLTAVSVRPSASDKRLVLIDDAQKLTAQAQNALLKTLEEPPGALTFVLTCDKTASLLPTVVSRCRVIRFRLPDADEAARALVRRGLSAERAKLLASLAEGSVGRALALDGNQKYWAARDNALAALASLTSPAAVAPAAKMLKDDKDIAPDALEMIARDLMAAQDDHAQARNTDVADKIARLPMPGQALLEGVLEMKKRLASNVSWTSALETLFLDMAGG